MEEVLYFLREIESLSRSEARRIKTISEERREASFVVKANSSGRQQLTRTEGTVVCKGWSRCACEFYREAANETISSISRIPDEVQMAPI